MCKKKEKKPIENTSSKSNDWLLSWKLVQFVKLRILSIIDYKTIVIGELLVTCQQVQTHDLLLFLR